LARLSREEKKCKKKKEGNKGWEQKNKGKNHMKKRKMKGKQNKKGGWDPKKGKKTKGGMKEERIKGL
jgi:hypothetical protein